MFSRMFKNFAFSPPQPRRAPMRRFHGQGRRPRGAGGVQPEYVPKGITVARASSHENAAGGLFQHPISGYVDEGESL